MLIRNLAQAEHSRVEAAGARGCAMAVMVGRADGAPNFAVRQIIVEPDGATPRHSHDYEHEVVVLDGRGVILCDGQEREIQPGDVVFVPAGQEHQFRATGQTPMRFLCMTPTRSGGGLDVPGT